MQAAIQHFLDIRFKLVNNAPMECMPTALSENYNNFILKSRINFSLASQKIKHVPVGINIVSFPEFTIMGHPNVPVDFHVEAKCADFEPIYANYGIKVIGPTIITSDSIGKDAYFGEPELYVTIKNESDHIFDSETGDDIAILEFVLKPCVSFKHIELPRFL